MSNAITLKAIDAAIASFATDAQAINNRAHDINMMILRHMAPKGCGEDFMGNGDCTRVPAMVMAMPASFRRTCEIDWWEKNTPVRVKFDGNKVTDFGFALKYLELKNKFKGDELEAERLKWWNVENAANEPFYTLAETTKEQAAKPFDLEAVIKLLNAIGAKIEKNKGEISDDQAQGIAEVKAGVDRLVGLATLAKAKAAVEATKKLESPSNVEPIKSNDVPDGTIANAMAKAAAQAA